MKKIAGLCAIAALAACNNSNSGGALPAEAAGELFPLGNDVPVTVNVMSSDRQAGNTVTVSRETATLTLNSFSLVDEEFDVTLTLPDGSSVNLTDATPTSSLFDVGFVQAFELTDADDNVVQVALGFNLDEPPAADELIFGVARVNLEEDPANDPDLDGFNTYLAFGDETDNMPTGWATYTGATIATAYYDGARINGDFTGRASIVADFDNSDVDMRLQGSYDGNDQSYSYDLFGQDIPIDGALYGGALGVTDGGHHTSTFNHGDTSIDLAGDVVGAFFGEDAAATAGVFGAEETNFEDADVEIVGGYAAYADNELVDIQ